MSFSVKSHSFLARAASFVAPDDAPGPSVDEKNSARQFFCSTIGDLWRKRKSHR
jgi:hypothetical protein